MQWTPEVVDHNSQYPWILVMLAGNDGSWSPKKSEGHHVGFSFSMICRTLTVTLSVWKPEVQKNQNRSALTRTLCVWIRGGEPQAMWPPPPFVLFSSTFAGMCLQSCLPKRRGACIETSDFCVAEMYPAVHKSHVCCCSTSWPSEGQGHVIPRRCRPTRVPTKLDTLAPVGNALSGVARINDVAFISCWAVQRLVSIFCGAACFGCGKSHRRTWEGPHQARPKVHLA